jgi:membrane-associated protease RseP (regulator of RpoE activity)
MSYVGAVVVVLLLLFVLVAAHELGHYVAARLSGFTVRKMVIGIPLPITLKKKKIASKKVTFGQIVVTFPWFYDADNGEVWTPGTLGPWKVGDLEISLNALLIGGGVDIPDHEYWSAGTWKRILVAMYGPAANIAMGLLVAWFFLGHDVGWRVSAEMIRASFTVALRLFLWQIPLAEMSGPVQAVRIYAYAVVAEPVPGSLFTFLMWTNLIPAINLLPIPAVDGGHVFISLLAAPFGEKGRTAAMWISKGFFYVLLVGMLLLIVRDFMG